MAKRPSIKSFVANKANKSIEKRLAKHVRLAQAISWLGLPGGIWGRLLVFVIVLIIPVVMWLLSFAMVILLLAGGVIAVHKLDPSIAVEKPKEPAEESIGGGGGGGKGVEVPENLKGKFFVPAGTNLSSAQGNRYVYGVPNYHDGIDFASGRKKIPVYPIYPGVVELAKWGGAFGNVVVVKHDVEGDIYYSLYAHLDSFSSKVGDELGYNDPVGIMGTTGNSTGIHVHLELFDKNYKWYDRTKTLQVAKYLTCDENGKLENKVQSITRCIDYRNKMTK